MSDPQHHEAALHGGVDQRHEVTIVVNGRKKEVAGKQISYTEVVNLAFDNNPPSGPYIVITVTYRKGPGPRPDGELEQGETVKIKDGMIFNVTATDKS